MAEGVDPHILALAGVDKLSSNGGKIGQSSFKNSDSEAFSRVLEQQRADSRKPSAEAPGQKQAANPGDESGKTVPPDEESRADASATAKTPASTPGGASGGEVGNETGDPAGSKAADKAADKAGNNEAHEVEVARPVVAEQQLRMARNTPTTADGAARVIGAPSPDESLARIAGRDAGTVSLSPTEDRPPVVSTGDGASGRKGDTFSGALARSVPAESDPRASRAVDSPQEAGELSRVLSKSPRADSEVAANVLRDARTASQLTGNPSPVSGEQATVTRLAGARGAAVAEGTQTVDSADAPRPQGAGAATEAGADAASRGVRNDNALASLRDRAGVGISDEGSPVDRSPAGETRNTPTLPDAPAGSARGSDSAGITAPGNAVIAAAAPANAATSSTATGMGQGTDLVMERAPDEAEFADEFTTRVKVLVRDGVREARIQLNPAELGRLQVTVSTDGDQARVSFVADTAAARDAIEQSLPRLREMLEQNGLQLTQSDVGHGGAANERGSERGASLAQADGDGAAQASDAGAEGGESRSTTGASRIDTYI